VADKLIVPFVPRSFDVWTLEKVASLVEEMRAANPRLKGYVFLNRADPQGRDNDEAAELLREAGGLEFLDTPIGTRKAFGNAASQGLAVTELKQQDPKATQEINALFRYLFQWFGQFSGRDRINYSVITKSFILRTIFCQGLARG